MRHFITAKTRSHLLAACLVLALWQCLTWIYPPLIIPTIPSVAGKIAGILISPASWSTMGLTVYRLAAGLALGIVAGAAAGFALGWWSQVDAVGKPLLGLVQAVPPVSWLVLAFIWFGFDGRPSVFIVAVSIFPIIAANLVEGVRSIDKRLVAVAQVYRFSAGKRFRIVVLPSIAPFFRSALRIAVGTGCKAVVMGEVLTTGNGIGGAITAARMNIEPETVVAWTVIIVALYYLLEFAASTVLAEPRRRQC